MSRLEIAEPRRSGARRCSSTAERLTTVNSEKMTMADANVTTDPHDSRANSTASPPHASERANLNAKPESASGPNIGVAAGNVCANNDRCLVSPLEEALEEERTRLMLADSVLGCLQIALDPEAIRVTPEPYFPEVGGIARQRRLRPRRR